MWFSWKNLKRALRYTFNALLVTGMIFVTGFLSFTGMLVLYNSVYFAICAFLLAGGIEGEVYAQNIHSSLLKMFTGDYWQDVILEQTLDKMLALTEDLDANPFLKDFSHQRRLVKQLEESDEASNEELEAALERLATMRRYFRDFIYQAGELPANLNPNTQPFHAELSAALARLGDEGDRQVIREQISSKKFYSGLAWILNFGAGISCFFVTLAVAQSSIAVLGAYFGFAITGAALTASIFGLAIVGAVGYMLLIHNTITDMLKNETLQEWGRNIFNFFSRKSNERSEQPESLPKYIARIVTGSLFVGLIVGLGIFATVATAGTWWYAAKAGAKLVPWFAKIATALAAVSVVLMASTTLVFNVVNSLRSMKELLKISIFKHYELTKKTFNKYLKIENFLQLMNPFRLIANLISLPFKFAIFVGHLFSMGVMADNLEGMHPLATAFIVTVNEAAQDGHYFLPEDDEEDACHEHDDDQPMKYDLQLMNYIPEEHQIRNSFTITKEPCRLLRIDAHGEAQEIFDRKELANALDILNLQDYLLNDPFPARSIKGELNREQLDILNDMIHSKLNEPTPQDSPKHMHKGHWHKHKHHHGQEHGAEPKALKQHRNSHSGHDHHHHDHGHGHEHHDHSHADLAGRFLNVILFPLFCLVALWDWVASKFNSDPQQVLSLGAAFRKTFFGLTQKKHAVQPPVISNAWLSFEKQMNKEQANPKGSANLSPNEPIEDVSLEEQYDFEANFKPALRRSEPSNTEKPKSSHPLYSNRTFSTISLIKSKQKTEHHHKSPSLFFPSVSEFDKARSLRHKILGVHQPSLQPNTLSKTPNPYEL